jgi:hypothetical protein
MSTFQTILLTAALAGMATAAHAQMQMPASQMPDASMPATAPQPAMMPPVMDNPVFAHALLDQFEGRIGGPNSEFRWDGQAWVESMRISGVWATAGRRGGKLDE